MQGAGQGPLWSVHCQPNDILMPVSVLVVVTVWPNVAQENFSVRNSVLFCSAPVLFSS